MSKSKSNSAQGEQPGQQLNQAIYVALRVRPFVPREEGEQRIVDCNAGRLSLLNPQAKNQTSFFDGFDELMDSSVETADPYYFDQARVYNKLGKKILKTVQDGYSAALFAYGQTGSGKTTSVMGSLEDEAEYGVLPRLLIDMFKNIHSSKRRSVRCSILEIYNERLRDLLIPRDKDAVKIDIRSHMVGPADPTYGNYIPNLTQERVCNLEEVMRCIEFAKLNQTVAATQMNAKSSRAHTVFTFNMLLVDSEEGSGGGVNDQSNDANLSLVQDKTSVTLHFVDLAGRENEKTTLARGERLVELGFINKSLFHLSNCIQSLGNSPKGAGNYPKMRGAFDPGMVNYRNSKITLLLQESLSGNSRTYMLGTLSPAASAFDENAVTLRFAATVKNIKTQSFKSTQKTDDRIVLLQQEVERLKKALKAAMAEAAEAATSRAEQSGSMSNSSSTNTSATTEQLQENLDAVEAALREQTRSAEEFQSEAKKLRQERQQMRVRLGVAKTLLLVEKQKKELLPFLSNESVDTHFCGRLEYSFAHCRSWWIGSDYDALVSAAKRDSSYEEFDTVPRLYAEHAIDSDKQPNCAQLYGFQMAPVLCKITKEKVAGEGSAPADGYELYLTLLADNGTGSVQVNATTLSQPNERHGPLLHGDKITLGRSFVFRVYLKNAAMEKSVDVLHTPRNRRSEFNTSTEVLDALKTLLPKNEFTDPFKLHHAKQFVSALRSLSLDHDKKTKKFLYEGVKLHALLDEAQTITDSLRPQDSIKFELAHFSPVVYYGYPESYVPQPVIRVARVLTHDWKKWRKQSSGFVSGEKEHVVSGNLHAALDFEHHHHKEHVDANTETLFVWTVGKFLARLDMMRDIYHAWQSGHELVVDLKQDPWVEAGPVEIEFWLEKHTKDIVVEKTDLLAKVDSLEKKLSSNTEQTSQITTEKQKLAEKVDNLEAQLKAIAAVRMEEEKAENKKQTETEMGLRKEIARLQVVTEQKDSQYAELEHSHAEQLLEQRRANALQLAAAEADTRRAREEVEGSLLKQKNHLEALFAEEKQTLQHRFELEISKKQHSIDELGSQIGSLKGTFEKRQLLTEERYGQLQEELKTQKQIMLATIEKEKKFSQNEKEVAVAQEKARCEREKNALRSELAVGRDQATADLSMKWEAERRELEAAVHQLQLEKEREMLKAEGVRINLEQQLESVAEEREALKTQKKELEQQIGKDGSAAQLKRCMELSLANQKLLDQFFSVKKGGSQSLGSLQSQGVAAGGGADGGRGRPNIVKMTAPVPPVSETNDPDS